VRLARNLGFGRGDPSVKPIANRDPRLLNMLTVVDGAKQACQFPLGFGEAAPDRFRAEAPLAGDRVAAKGYPNAVGALRAR